MREQDPFRDFDARMAKLDPKPGGDGKNGDTPPRGAGHAGMHVGTEIVAGVLGGALMGYGIDYVFETYPFGLLAMLVLGSAAGMLNAFRAIQKMDQAGKEETASRDISGGK